MSSSAISVSNLIKIYTRRRDTPLRAVDGISFEVPQGTIFGLLGPNGAGKSTTIKVLTTLLPPTSGRVSVLGHDVTTDPLSVRKQICVVLQENAIELFLSVQDNFRTFARFHGVTGAAAEKAMDRVLELFSLRDARKETGIDLSGGMKRRVQVAKVFMVEKPVVFLDEATTGMDTINKRATIEAVREEAARGRTIVLTTHMLEEAEELCSSVVIINHGKIVAQGTIDDVKAMGLRLFNISLTVAGDPERLLPRLRRFKPQRLEVSRTTVHLTVQDERTMHAILEIVRRSKLVRSFEITNASLEDVFVELIDKKDGAA
ncbi:MAG: ABC transporter ATP-binding protein [Bacteroidetes bacterium]|nr:ABC transporter ATP-binding protein [Bacteroidota bacterium]